MSVASPHAMHAERLSPIQTKEGRSEYVPVSRYLAVKGQHVMQQGRPGKQGGRGGRGVTDLESKGGVGWEVIKAAGNLVEACGLADGANEAIGKENALALGVS